MLDFDYSNFIMEILYEVDEVIAAFRSFKDELPYNFITEGRIEPDRIVQTVDMPGIGKATFIWEPNDKGEVWRTSIIKEGIEQLMAIGDRFNVAAEDIRIVFAFDN